jgi:hypothetical protein
MAMIHVNRTGTSLGTFPEEDVREGLRTGRFAPTDLGWREGMATWQPLSQFPEFAATAPGAPPSQPPPPTSPIAPVPIESTPEIPPARSGLPWEHRQERGLASAFFETLVMVLTKPAVAFTTMKREGGLGEPLIYALIGGSFGFVIYFLFLLLMPSFATLGDRHNALAGLFGLGIGLVFLIILLPLFIAIWIFIGSAIIHVCLMIVGGAKQSFETTCRVVCFATGSAQPLMVVPLCGGLISGVWGLVAECIGLARAHETDTGRAVLAVFLPLIVCCGGGILLAIVFGGLGALSQHGSQ